MSPSTESLAPPQPEAVPRLWSLLEKRAATWILLSCACYFVLEVFYVLRLPLVMDEFQGLRRSIDFATTWPYRDFRPYKTVLGYYLQLPALLLGASPWWSLMAVKLQMAFFTSVALAWGASSYAVTSRRLPSSWLSS